jgi:hypothetical protein
LAPGLGAKGLTPASPTFFGAATRDTFRRSLPIRMSVASVTGIGRSAPRAVPSIRVPLRESRST